MKIWEYKVVTVDQFSWFDQATMNHCGSEGWELVSVIITPNMLTLIYFYKREKLL